jgi:hypothetical protein
VVLISTAIEEALLEDHKNNKESLKMIILSKYAGLRLAIPLAMILAFQSCEVPPQVRVEPTNPPRFTFSRGTVVDGLLVYHLKGDQRKNGVFLDTLMADKENTCWMIGGEHDNQSPITYGAVPVGMEATIQAKPLIEGEYYMVYVTSLVGATFVIKDGMAKDVTQREE